MLSCAFHKRRENGKIDKLTEDLYDASRAIHCNEQMLREIKHSSRDHRREMAQVCMHTVQYIHSPKHEFRMCVEIHLVTPQPTYVLANTLHCTLPTVIYSAP